MNILSLLFTVVIALYPSEFRKIGTILVEYRNNILKQGILVLLVLHLFIVNILGVFEILNMF